MLSSYHKYSTQAARTGGGAGQQAEGEHGYVYGQYVGYTTNYFPFKSAKSKTF